MIKNIIPAYLLTTDDININKYDVGYNKRNVILFKLLQCQTQLIFGGNA